MYSFNIDKILLQRALRNTRSFSPLDNFFKQLELIESLYFDIEKNIESHKHIQLARKQLVISIVSALEVFFKDTIMISYDSGSFSNSYIVKKMKKNFFLPDIEEIIKNRITIGEILASVFTFTNLRSVNKVFSGLINNNFFKELNNYKFEIKVNSDEKDAPDTVNVTSILEEDKKIYFILKDLYAIRPFITHDQLEKSSITEYQVQNFISSSGLFALVIDNYMCSIINDESNLNI